jgi:hypothetical protein
MDVVSTLPGVGGKGKRSRRRIPRTPRAGVASPTLPPVTYERTPGAASSPLPGVTPSGGIYRRHEPEKTVLYGVVQEHLETFLDQAAVAALRLAGSVLAGASLSPPRRKGRLSFVPATCPRNRGWPHAGGATALVLEPLDFLRRLAALVSFPYAHGVRYHGLC